MTVSEVITALQSLPEHSPVQSNEGMPVLGVRWQGNHVEFETDEPPDDGSGEDFAQTSYEEGRTEGRAEMRNEILATLPSMNAAARAKIEGLK